MERLKTFAPYLSLLFLAAIVVITSHVTAKEYIKEQEYPFKIYVADNIYTITSNTIINEEGDSLTFSNRKEALKHLEELTKENIIKRIDTSKYHYTKASWYGPGFEGKKTASGEIYDSNLMTCASTVLPLGTKIEVTNLDNNQSIQVIVNDRGPYDCFIVDGKVKPYRPLRKHPDRLIDLSKAAFSAIASTKKGIINIKYKLI